MNSTLPRLFVAVTAFVLSVGLTSVVRLFRSEHASIAPVNIFTLGERRAEIEFPLDADRSRLLDLYLEYGPAQTRHDRAFFERVETEDFILFVGDEHISREDDIRWMEKLPNDDVYDCDPESIDVIGDWALVRGRMQARHGDGDIEEWGFIDVWVRRGDTWRIQSTTSTD
jgi:hypothetical protein